MHQQVLRPNERNDELHIFCSKSEQGFYLEERGVAVQITELKCGKLNFKRVCSGGAQEICREQVEKYKYCETQEK